MGAGFEAAIVDAAGLSSLNVEPGSLRIDELSAPNVTVRVTVIGSVAREVVAAAGCAVFEEGS
jgi:hypothetical protein